MIQVDSDPEVRLDSRGTRPFISGVHDHMDITWALVQYGRIGGGQRAFAGSCARRTNRDSKNQITSSQNR
jgi:hypothetical protein